jgi:hypothetical protein
MKIFYHTRFEVSGTGAAHYPGSEPPTGISMRPSMEKYHHNDNIIIYLVLFLAWPGESPHLDPRSVTGLVSVHPGILTGVDFTQKTAVWEPNSGGSRFSTLSFRRITASQLFSVGDGFVDVYNYTLGIGLPRTGAGARDSRVSNPRYDTRAHTLCWNPSMVDTILA